MYGLSDDPMVFLPGTVRRIAPPQLHQVTPVVKKPPQLHQVTPSPPPVPMLAPEDTGPPPEPEEMSRMPIYIAVGGVAVLGVLYLVMRK